MRLSYHRDWAKFVPYPVSEQKREQDGVYQGVPDVAFDAPDVVNNAEDSGEINRLVQELPPLSTES